MPEIRCTNFAGFDEVTQSYKRCNQKIKIPENRLGREITCPKCHQPLVVGEFEQDPLELAALDSTTLQKSGDVMSMDFENPAQTAKVFETSKKRCPQCGGLFGEDGVCQVCNYVEPVQAAKRRQSDNTPLRTAGFQLWLQSTAADGVSLKVIGYIVFAVSCLFGLVMIAFGILSQSILGAVIAAIAAFYLFFIFSVFLKTKQLATQRNAELGILSPFWNLILTFARMQDWQKYDSRLRGRVIIDRRDKPVNDAELAQLGGLKNCQVLDLENSTITDNGLKVLYGLPNLRCLVLKNTDVSDEAVTTLQQQYPRLWIWK